MLRRPNARPSSQPGRDALRVMIAAPKRIVEHKQGRIGAATRSARPVHSNDLAQIIAVPSCWQLVARHITGRTIGSLSIGCVPFRVCVAIVDVNVAKWVAMPVIGTMSKSI